MLLQDRLLNISSNTYRAPQLVASADPLHGCLDASGSATYALCALLVAVTLHPGARLLLKLLVEPPHLDPGLCARLQLPSAPAAGGVTPRAVAGGPGRAEWNAEDVVAPAGADELRQRHAAGVATVVREDDTS
jgi:hypothetical protein